MAALSSSQSSSKKIMWPKELEADLIEEVRKVEYLWNTKHPYYTKKTLKRVAYEEIAANLTRRWPDYSTLFDTDNVLTKFGTLRSSYKRELKKIRILKSGSEGIGFTPRWVHWSTLSFLEDTVRAEDSSSNLDSSQLTIVPNTDEYDCAPEIDDEEEVEELPIVTPNDKFAVQGCSTAPQHSHGKKRKNDAQENDDLIKEAGQLLKKLNSSDSDDAYGHFIVNMLHEIKDLKKRHMARIEIQQLLLNYIYE